MVHDPLQEPPTMPVPAAAEQRYESVVRPRRRVTIWLIVAVAGLGVALTLATQLGALQPDPLQGALPVLFTLAATTATAAAYLIGGRSRSQANHRLAWMADAFAVTALATWLQLLGFPTIAPTGGPLGTTGSGTLGVSVVFHLVLPLFALLGCSPLRHRVTLRRTLTAAALLAVLWMAIGPLPGPSWVASDGTYLPPVPWILWAAATLTVVAIAAWIRATGPRPLWTEAWVTAALLFTAWDAGLHAIAPGRLTSWWWASFGMRLLGAVVPAVGLVAAAVALFRRLDRYTTDLERWTQAQAATNDELSRMNAELHAINAELDAYAGVIAHDLRSPVATAAGLVDLVVSHFELEPEARRMLERARASLRHQSELIGDLLGLARARDGALELTPVPLDRVVDELVRSSPQFESAVRVVGPLPVVQADASAIRQVLHNLIGNAVAYAADGQPARVEVAAHPHGGSAWRVEVTDNGPGIAAEERERIFDPFVRGANSQDRPGTGLGLAICQRLVRRHGGAIGVEPADDGSRFWFTLPAATASTEAASPPAGTDRLMPT